MGSFLEDTVRAIVDELREISALVGAMKSDLRHVLDSDASQAKRIEQIDARLDAANERLARIEGQMEAQKGGPTINLDARSTTRIDGDVDGDVTQAGGDVSK